MLIKQLPVVLFCLIKAREAASSVPQILGLSDCLSQITIKDGALETRANVLGNTKPLLSLFEISEKVEELIGKIPVLDVKTAVEIIENGLVQILDAGATLDDIAPAIGSLPVDAKELVLVAIEKKAYILLKLLQKAYIWRDERQHHWFKAQSYESLWYDKAMWEDPEPFPLDWKKNLWAVCKADNVALAMAVRREIPRGSALESFDEELLLLCVEYDAIKIFKSATPDPIRLEKHLELLARNSAAKLLNLYQIHKGIKHLRLDEYPFPNKLPANVDDFKFLMANGYNFLSMKKFIAEFCKMGRLDLLMYLHDLSPGLVPDKEELAYAAEKNFKDILSWSLQFVRIHDHSQSCICNALLANRHFDTLYWWMDENEIGLDQKICAAAAESGALKVFQWFDNRSPIDVFFRSIIIGSAISNRHFHVLEWLYEKSQNFPAACHLSYATGEVLDWVKSKSNVLENSQLTMRLSNAEIKYEDLVEHGADNFELLQWTFKNAPLSVFDTKKEILSKKMKSKEMMVWLYENLQICPSEMWWACWKGDLEAIKWAAANCNIYPRETEIRDAAKKGHLHVITWIHENVYPNNPSCFIDTLSTAIACGNPEIAEYLLLHVFPEEEVEVYTCGSVSAEKHLATLKWGHERGFRISQLETEMAAAIRNEDIQTLEWISFNFPTSKPCSDTYMHNIISNDHHEFYKWFLQKYPKLRKQDKLYEDALTAFEHGSLGVLKVLFEEDPSLRVGRRIGKPSSNYHVCEWLVANGHSFEQLQS